MKFPKISFTPASDRYDSWTLEERKDWGKEEESKRAAASGKFMWTLILITWAALSVFVYIRLESWWFG